MLTIHLSNHAGRPEAQQENAVANLPEHLRWQPAFTQRVVRLAERHCLVERNDGLLTLTEQGLQRASQEFAA
jgi:hypothetical protein